MNTATGEQPALRPNHERRCATGMQGLHSRDSLTAASSHAGHASRGRREPAQSCMQTHGVQGTRCQHLPVPAWQLGIKLRRRRPAMSPPWRAGVWAEERARSGQQTPAAAGRQAAPLRRLSHWPAPRTRRSPLPARQAPTRPGPSPAQAPPPPGCCCWRWRSAQTAGRRRAGRPQSRCCWPAQPAARSCPAHICARQSGPAPPAHMPAPAAYQHSKLCTLQVFTPTATYLGAAGSLQQSACSKHLHGVVLYIRPTVCRAGPHEHRDEEHGAEDLHGSADGPASFALGVRKQQRAQLPASQSHRPGHLHRAAT